MESTDAVATGDEESLGTGLRRQAADLQDLVGKISGYTLDLKKLEAQCTQLKHERQALARENHSLETNLTSLKAQSSEMERERDRLRSELSQAIREVDEYVLPEFNEQGKAVRSAWRSGLETGLKESRKEASTEIANLNQCILDEQAISDSLRARIGRLESALKERSNDLEKANKTVKEIGKSMDGVKEWSGKEVSRLRKENGDLQRAIREERRKGKEEERKVEQGEEKRVEAEEKARVAEMKTAEVVAELERVKTVQAATTATGTAASPSRIHSPILQPLRALQPLSPNRLPSPPLRATTPNRTVLVPASGTTSAFSPHSYLPLSALGPDHGLFSLDPESEFTKGPGSSDYARLRAAHEGLREQYKALKKRYDEDWKNLKEWKKVQVKRDEAKRKRREEKREKKRAGAGAGGREGQGKETQKEEEEGSKREDGNSFSRVPETSLPGNESVGVDDLPKPKSTGSTLGPPTPSHEGIDRLDCLPKIPVDPTTVEASIDVPPPEQAVAPQVGSSRLIGPTMATRSYPRRSNVIQVETDGTVNPGADNGSAVAQGCLPRVTEGSKAHTPKISQAPRAAEQTTTPVSRPFTYSTPTHAATTRAPTTSTPGLGGPESRRPPIASRVTPWLGKTKSSAALALGKTVSRSASRVAESDSFEDDEKGTGEGNRGQGGLGGEWGTPGSAPRALVRDRTGAGSVTPGTGGLGAAGSLRRVALERNAARPGAGTDSPLATRGQMDGSDAVGAGQNAARQTSAGKQDGETVDIAYDEGSPVPRGATGANLSTSTGTSTPSAGPSLKRKLDLDFDLNLEGLSPRDRAIQLKKIAKLSVAEKRDLYAPYKGKGRYIPASELSKTVQDEYEIDPAQNDGAKHAFHEVRRGRAERKQMHGGDCECCRDYYTAVGYLPRFNQPTAWNDPLPVSGATETADAGLGHGAHERGLEHREELEDHRNRISRHRDVWRPPPTPPEYWTVAFPTTQQVEEMNERADQTKREREAQVRREATHKNSKWKKRT